MAHQHHRAAQGRQAAGLFGRHHRLHVLEPDRQGLGPGGRLQAIEQGAHGLLVTAGVFQHQHGPAPFRQGRPEPAKLGGAPPQPRHQQHPSRAWGRSLDGPVHQLQRLAAMGHGQAEHLAAARGPAGGRRWRCAWARRPAGGEVGPLGWGRLPLARGAAGDRQAIGDRQQGSPLRQGQAAQHGQGLALGLQLLAPLGGHGHQGIEVEVDPAGRHRLQQVDGGHRLLMVEQLAQGLHQQGAARLQLGGLVRWGRGRWCLGPLGGGRRQRGQGPWRGGIRQARGGQALGGSGPGEGSGRWRPGRPGVPYGG